MPVFNKWQLIFFKKKNNSSSQLNNNENEEKNLCDFFLITLSQLYLKQIPGAPSYSPTPGSVVLESQWHQDENLKCIPYLQVTLESVSFLTNDSGL